MQRISSYIVSRDCALCAKTFLRINVITNIIANEKYRTRQADRALFATYSRVLWEMFFQISLRTIIFIIPVNGEAILVAGNGSLRLPLLKGKLAFRWKASYGYSLFV
jgi:hypothetical protein